MQINQKDKQLSKYYKRKTPRKEDVKVVNARRERDQSLAPLLQSMPVTPEEIVNLHRGDTGEIVVDDMFYDLVRRLVHFGAVTESTVYYTLGIGADIWQKKKAQHPELIIRFMQYVADRDLLIQAYTNNILFDPDHKDHAKMLMHYDKSRHMRDNFRLRNDELNLRKAIANTNLEAARLSQPNVQQVIAVLPAQQNAIAQMSPDEVMRQLSQAPLSLQIKGEHKEEE